MDACGILNNYLSKFLQHEYTIIGHNSSWGHSLDLTQPQKKNPEIFSGLTKRWTDSLITDRVITKGACKCVYLTNTNVLWVTEEQH